MYTVDFRNDRGGELINCGDSAVGVLVALFMPRQSVITFSQLRMTIQSLFSQSEMLPILSGQEQIGNFRQLILRP